MRDRLVAGLDVWKGQWVAVALKNGLLESVAVVPSAASVSATPSVAVIAIDIPIGLPRLGTRRAADAEAHRWLGPRRSSVFFTPAVEELGAIGHAEPVRMARSDGHSAMSVQTWGLKKAILEVAGLARVDPRVYEVHPAVSFRQMAGAPMQWSKKSWNGMNVRRRASLPTIEAESSQSAPLIAGLSLPASRWSSA